MTYIEYVKNYLEQQGQGTPIYTDEITKAVAADYGIDKKKAAAATAVAVKRIMDKGEFPDLRCYQKGIYYRTAVTPFGEMGISREKLTTQMPTEHLLATSGARDCVRYDSKLGVSICPPKAPVNAENKADLQTLDALDLLDKAPVDAQNPYTILADHIRKNGLQYETLLYYADRYYNRKTIIRLAHTAGRKEVRI